jgi:hypothetical protein
VRASKTRALPRKRGEVDVEQNRVDKVVIFDCGRRGNHERQRKHDCVHAHSMGSAGEDPADVCALVT